MGLKPGDLEKVPNKMSVTECYERIFNWHKKNGEKRIKEIYKRDDAYSKAYIDLLDVLPLPGVATQGDIDFVFGEVISMLMEWSFHEVDKYGIKIGAYAHFALDKQYANGFGDEKYKKSKENSSLFDKFGDLKWKDKYE